MMPLLTGYRLTRAGAHPALDGAAGHWVGPDTPVWTLASSVGLAVAHLTQAAEGLPLGRYVCVTYVVPFNFPRRVWSSEDLPPDWRHSTPACRARVATWARDRHAPGVLVVPSPLAPSEDLYLVSLRSGAPRLLVKKAAHTLDLTGP